MKRFISAVVAITLVVSLSGSVRAAAAADPKAVLDKAIKALGGEAALSKVKAASIKSRTIVTIRSNNNVGSTVTIFDGLNHIRQVFESQINGKPYRGITLINGDKGVRNYGGNRTDLEKEKLVDAKFTLSLTVLPVTLLPLKGKGFTLATIDEQKINDKPAAGLKVTTPDKKEIKLYFDKRSGLPVKLVATVPAFQSGEYTQETTFSDYKDMAGIKKATKIVLMRDGVKFQEQQVTEFKILRSVDPKTFTTAD